MWSLPCIDLFPFFLFNMNAFLKVFIRTWWIAAVLDWTPFMLTLPRTFLHSAGHNPSLSASRVIYRPALLPSWQLDWAYLVSPALWVTLAAWGVNMIPAILMCLGCHSKILKSCLTFISYTQGDLETQDQGPKGFHVWGGLFLTCRYLTSHVCRGVEEMGRRMDREDGEYNLHCFLICHLCSEIIWCLPVDVQLEGSTNM